MSYTRVLKQTQRPSGILEILINTAGIQWIGASNLPSEGAIAITGSAFHHIAEAVLARQKNIDSTSFSVLKVPDAELGASNAIRTALEEGRRQGIAVVPLGIAAAPTTSILGSRQFPLLHATIVACSEVPFVIPDIPKAISDDWIQALQQQLKLATGRALDHLRSIRRSNTRA